MNRRGFLLSTSTAIGAAAAWPALVSNAFAQDRVPEDGALAGLSEAYRTAQRSARPLLVLVIPDDNGARWDRGSALGAFLNTGSDAAMVAVGSCEVTCATMTVLRQLVPQAPAGEPLMVLVDPTRVPAVVSAIDPALPAEIPFPAGDANQWDAHYAQLDARVDQQVAAIEGALLEALRARSSSMSSAQRDAARARAVDTYRAHRIRGSYWANQSGCGVHVEEVPVTGGIGCGMGHTPVRARRFLYFFAPQGNPI
ncbi:MAG: hypothetical protein J0L92_19850 [Deltaproteobacteria bacterium]|nr:hypothetical protein [Deltaproteobacteria bacterium]